MHYIIVNPMAKSGNGKKTWKEIERKLSGKKEFQILYTEKKGHATELIREICKEHPDNSRVTVLGGDGSLNEVTNGMCRNSGIPISYFPAGSGNDFARGMKLKPVTWEGFQKILQHTTAKQVDCGQISITGTEISRKFNISTGIGFDAAVCEQLDGGKIKPFFNKFHLGKLAYVIVGIQQIIKTKMVSGELILDGEKHIPLKKLAFVSVQNLPFEGGGFSFTPNADPCDGSLNVCVMEATSRLNFTMHLAATLLGGKQGKRKGVGLYSCKTASIRLDEKRFLHTDGEVIGCYDRLDIECCPGEHEMIL